MSKWLIGPLALASLSLFVFSQNAQSKGKTYTCNQVRGAGSPQVVEKNLNNMAAKGYKFLYWDSQNYIACFKK